VRRDGREDALAVRSQRRIRPSERLGVALDRREYDALVALERAEVEQRPRLRLAPS
jgi:hypothetical protein